MSDQTQGNTSDGDKVERRAKHGLVTANGGETKKFEEAAAITYALLGNVDDVFTYDVKAAPEHARTMLALFGARTLATNTASQIRQKDGDEDEQMEAVKDRFAQIDDGIWVERAERVGAKVDLGVLAKVYCDYAASEGQTKDYDVVLKTITENRGTKAKILNALREQYREAMGKAKVDPKSTLGLIG